jgi:hypothetical protein
MLRRTARGGTLLLCALALAHATAPAADAYTGFEPLDCVACRAGEYLSRESLNCTACPAGSGTFEYTNASSPLHCLCAPGFENASAACEMCGLGFYKEVLANTTCTRCVAHSDTLAAGSANVSACVCDPGFSKPHLATLPPGPEDHARPCEPCAPGSFKRAQADEACGACLADHFCPEGSVEPTACPANSSAAPGRAAVEECLCHAGFHFARDEAGGFYCEPCAPGFYNELVNQSACVACPADTFNPDTAAPAVARCRACDPNAAAPPASFAVEACACNLGYAGAPGEACVACEPGTFRENSSRYICEECPANTFNVFHNASSRAACLACHTNTSSAAGSRSQRACVCDPGLFGVLDTGPQPVAAGTEGVYVCTACAPGSFSDAKNASVCALCAAGKFSTARGAPTGDTCLACASGSVTLEPGLTACAPCGASTWQNTSAPGHLALPCEACPANASHAQESVVDVFTCVCAPGVYKLPLDFGFRCALCEPGARCPGADRLEDCPFNTFSVGGVVTECTPCAPLSRAATSAPLASPEQCQCVPGAEGAFHEHCSLCAPGKFQPLDLTFNGTGATGGWFVDPIVDRVRAQAVECGQCPADQFQPALGATACVACHAHSSTAGAAGSDAAEDCTCDAGFVGEDGVACSLCEPGRFCPGGEVATVCRLFSHSPAGSWQEANCSCNAGYYSVNRTAACDKCLPGAWCAGGVGYVPCANASTSAAGARVVEQCFCEPGFWRGCTRTKDLAGRGAGFVDAAGQPCAVQWEQPCVQCGPNDVCVNDTLLHCPDHSASPPGSDDRFDCVCNSGYCAEYYR